MLKRADHSTPRVPRKGRCEVIQIWYPVECLEPEPMEEDDDRTRMEPVYEADKSDE